MIDRQHGREALLISLRGLGRITICGQDFKTMCTDRFSTCVQSVHTVELFQKKSNAVVSNLFFFMLSFSFAGPAVFRSVGYFSLLKLTFHIFKILKCCAR